VLTIGVEEVDVVASRAAGGHAQARAHFLGEDQVPQALRGENIFFSARPKDFQGLSRCSIG